MIERYEELKEVARRTSASNPANAFGIVAEFLNQVCGFQLVELLACHGSGATVQRLDFRLVCADGVVLAPDALQLTREPARAVPSAAATVDRGVQVLTPVLQPQSLRAAVAAYRAVYGERLALPCAAMAWSPVGLPEGPGELRIVGRLDHLEGEDFSELDVFTLAYLADTLATRLARGGRPAVVGRRLVGFTHAMQRVHALIEVYGRVDLPLLIVGERGTGKGLVAREAHAIRGSDVGAFFSLNCAAVPETLVESELFGHRRGAYTGAVSDRDGLLLTAFRQRGGLLLDDVAEFPSAIQPKLLHAVEERRFYPVGSDRPVSIVNGEAPGLRLYATSQPAALSRLRPDLRDRLSACFVELPPLRDRALDILVIADRTVAGLSTTTGVLKQLDWFGRKVLQEYTWPGNVRQLQNVLQRAFILTSDEPGIPSSTLTSCIETEQRLEGLLAGDAGSDGDPQSPVTADRFATLEEVQARHIRAALDRTRGNVTAAARLLGLKRTTLQSRLRVRAPRS